MGRFPAAGPSRTARNETEPLFVGPAPRGAPDDRAAAVGSARDGKPVRWTIVSIFFDLFSSGNRHRIEESRRQENTREEEGQSEPGRGPIDLTSGTVLIRPAAKKPEPDGDAAAPEEDGGA